MSIWWEKAIFSFNTASPGIHLTFLTSAGSKKMSVIRIASKTPGVMITQYVVSIPEGKSAPDFLSKPIPLTIKEGKVAIFKVVVTGDPKPEVSWRRAKGPTTDKDKFQIKYDDSTGEHILEIIKVSGEESDTYKCSAANEYGKAVCTTTLNVDEGESKIYTSKNPSDFRKLLRRSKGQEKAGGETDERFWDKMLNADKKDYKRICTEFGVADLDLILKKLDEKKKKERAQNKCKYPLCTWQDGAMSYDEDGTENHGLASAGRTTNSNIKGLMQRCTGLDQVDEEGNLLFTGLNLTEEELTAEERQDALFACVLTHPLPTITWMGKGRALAEGEKYSITVSEHKLIHRLLIKDCDLLDKGIYSAVAGDASCSAWLDVQADSDPASAGLKRKKFAASVPTRKDCDLRCAPTFSVPLKLHTAPKGYECYMSCAVKGNPRPRITWYRNHISLNTNTNYYISNTCGVCSMSILRVGPKDTGEYTISAENALGRAECSTVLSVRGERETLLHFNSNDGWNVKNQMHYAESISSVFHTE
uniref:Ig-like domain-containing protein n=1 Tax=Cyclopterus lumpus TaxID=8103 RepID=A0A8C2WJI0_CYCLU